MKVEYSANIIRTICWFLSLTILIYAGVFLHVRWDLKRFKASLGKPSAVSSMYVLQREIELEPVGLEMEIETPALEELDFLINESFPSELALSGEETIHVKYEHVWEERITQEDQFQDEVVRRRDFAALK